MHARPASLVLAGCLCTAALPALAQETITLSTWGSGTLVRDELGLFGAPQAGESYQLPFTLSISIDTATMRRQVSPGYASFQDVDGVPGGLAGEITVAGQSWQWGIAAPRASAAFSWFENSVSMFTGGIDRASGHDTYVYEMLAPEDGSARFVQSDDYRDTATFADVRNQRSENGSFFSGAYFWVTGNIACADCPAGVREGLTWFVSDEPNFGRWSVSPVPEPSGRLMLAGGAALLLGMRRRRAALLVSAR